VADIEGTKTKPQKTKPERVTNHIEDIQGACTKKPYTRQKPYDSTAYSEVYAKDW